MLYLEDYLELIEHLPQELRDRFTDIRERDLQVHNSSEQLKEKVKHFFAEAKKLKPEQAECEYQRLLDSYLEIEKYADDKVHIAGQMHDIMIKLVNRLDTELERFKLELEADHAGITEELEKRSLELDSDTRFDDLINNHLNSSHSSACANSPNESTVTLKQPSGMKDRRRSEHKHRHHPYNNNQSNGYHGRGKLSNKEQELSTNSIYSTHNHSNNRQGVKTTSSGFCRQQSVASSLYPAQIGSPGYSSSAPASVAGDANGIEQPSQVGTHQSSLAKEFNSNGLYNKHLANLPLNKQHSALSAALALNNSGLSNGFTNASSNHNKISGEAVKDGNSHLTQNPIAAAASQAIAATQQVTF